MVVSQKKETGDVKDKRNRVVLLEQKTSTQSLSVLSTKATMPPLLSSQLNTALPSSSPHERKRCRLPPGPQTPPVWHLKLTSSQPIATALFAIQTRIKGEEKALGAFEPWKEVAVAKVVFALKAATGESRTVEASAGLGLRYLRSG